MVIIVPDSSHDSDFFPAAFYFPCDILELVDLAITYGRGNPSIGGNGKIEIGKLLAVGRKIENREY